MLELLFGGIAIGCIYSLIALGYSMIIKATEILNFAQGEVMMLGSMFGISLLWILPFPFIVIFFLTIALTGFFSLLMELVVFRVLRNRRVPLINIVMATVGMSILLQNVARLIWGSEPLSYPPIFKTAAYFLGSVRLPAQYLAVVVLGLVLMITLQLFFKKSRTGIALQAAAQDPETAQLMGINLNRTVSYTFFISGGMAGAAGTLLGPMFFSTFDMGFMTGIKSFVAASLGGLGSITGAMLGGIIFGVLETFGALWISSAYKDAIGMILLIVILLVFPNGLIGLRDGRRFRDGRR